MNLTKSKLVMGIASAAVAFSFALTPVMASADTASDLQAQINSLLSTIQSLQAQLAASTGGSSSTMTGYTFNTNLTVGSTGTDVMNLQKVLNMSADTQVASGVSAGAPDHETSTFGPATKAAVMKFQTKYGISPVAGYVGAITRAKLNSMGGTVSTTPTTPTTPVVGGSLVFGASTQPANSLAPQGAARVPFTTFTLTNTGTNVATVNGVTVQRTGLGVDAVFSGVVLVDSNNVQIGTSKTFNSNHQATVGDVFTLNPGETKTLTIAGNMASSLGSYAGQVVSLTVVGVNSTATVSGSFPVTGAAQTINATLSLGSVSTSTSSFDPGSAQTKNIGDVGVRFSGIKFTAASAEDLKLYSLRWRQVGTASSADFSNVVTIVNGTSYPTMVSADGKYYTSVFPGGILIPKGNSIDVYAQGDITGSNSNLRTVDFDIDKVTDVYFVGQLFGYGVAASGTFTPWYDGKVTTINAGTVTTISKANEVTAQNIASNVPNQVLGGFATNFSGEPVSVTSMVFNFGTTSAGLGSNVITSVSLVDSNGAVVAGPVDATWTSSSKQTITFSDTVTFPVGRKVYTLKGKVPSSASNGAIITADTTPSGWSSPTGTVTGSNVTISTANFTMNAVTVKAANLTVNVSTQPTSQNVVAGSQNLVLANFQLDASNSGEDIRLSSFPIDIAGTSAGSDLTGCQLWDGTTALNTGSRVVNSFTASTPKVVSFDNSLTVSKGTIKTLALSCNVSSSGANTYQELSPSTIGNSNFSITGVTSGNSVSTSDSSLTLGTGVGGVMTIQTGSLAMSVDPSSPSYAVVAGGSTGVTVGVIKLRPSNDSINLTKLGLYLNNGSSTDVTNTYLYQGGTLIGTATFTGSNTSATSTLLNSGITLAKDVDTLITVKADFADVGTSQSGTRGKFVKIDPLNAQGTGVGSGSTLNASSTIASNTAGVRVFNSYPTFALGTLASSGGADGRLMRFSITASPAGPVGIQQLVFNIATVTATVSNVGLYAYSGSDYSTGAIATTQGSGQIGSGNITLAYPNGSSSSGSVAIATSTAQTNPTQIPAGTTYYFELRASVTGGGTTGSVVTTLKGDSAYPLNYSPIDYTQGYFVATSSALTSAAGLHNVIWSGNSTSTSSTSDVDWTNGYGLPGLGSSGLIQSRSY